MSGITPRHVSGLSTQHRPARTFKPLLTCTVLTAALMAAGAARAQTSPYYLGVAQSVGHESNLLRLNTGINPDGYSRSDTVSSTSLLAGVDQPIGRQRLRGDVALRTNRYSKNDIYNNQSYTANLGLDWETINRLSGKVSASANRSLLTFNNQQQSGLLSGLLRERDYETTKTLDASAQVGVVTQYSLYAAAGYRQVDNSLNLPNVQTRNFRQQTLSAGVRWQPSSLLNLGVGLRGTTGRYPQYRHLGNGIYEADSFKRQDIDLTANWAPSGQSTINARLSTGKTDYDLDALRNYSGVTGALTWNWQTSGKLRLTTSLSRDTGQESYGVTVFQTPASADYSRVNTTARLGADWSVSSKVSLNASLAHTDRDLTRNVSALPGAASSGKERSEQFSIGARWAPLRSVLLGCNINNDSIRGSGDYAATNIKSTGYSCYGQLMLQ